MATYTTGDVFCGWVTSPTQTGTDSYTNAVWESWTGTSDSGTTDSTSTYTEDVWSSWSQAVVYIKRWDSAESIIPAKVSSELKRARGAQREINAIWRDIKIVEEDERKQLAELTAQELLEDLIGEKELALYNETNRLVVRGHKNDYVIKKGGGVYKVDKGKVIDLCIHLKQQYKYPITDNVIALKVLIEGDEKTFLKTANSHGELRNERVKQEMLKLVGMSEVAA